MYIDTTYFGPLCPIKSTCVGLFGAQGSRVLSHFAIQSFGLTIEGL